MLVDPSVVPGLLLCAAELLVLAAVGYVVVRVALGQTDDLMALAQGLVVGLALWGLVTNFVVYLLPGLAGALVGWMVVLAIGAGLAWRGRERLRPEPRVLRWDLWSQSLRCSGSHWPVASLCPTRTRISITGLLPRFAPAGRTRQSCPGIPEWLFPITTGSIC